MTRTLARERWAKTFRPLAVYRHELSSVKWMAAMTTKTLATLSRPSDATPKARRP